MMPPAPVNLVITFTANQNREGRRLLARGTIVASLAADKLSNFGVFFRV